MQSPDPLIRTKLRPPFIRPDLIARPSLHARIAEGLRYPLTLVVAPAGFGKTTLVAASLANCPMPVAWLSLEKNDNQVTSFLAYLIAALQRADPQIGSEAAHLIQGMQQAPPEAVMTCLVNDLDGARGDLVLVLEDYHLITNPAIHETVTFLLEHCPSTFHILIATRSDPPLPLARLRARGRMIELRAVDLRFTPAEAAQYLNEVMRLNLDAASVSVLEERTEGWIAGLQMAAVSLRDREDVSGFIEGFSGSNRYILDYLMEEILAGQPPEIQRFLLYTSILERLTAPLCDVLLVNSEPRSVNGSDSLFTDHGSGYSQSTLDYIDRSNLFLIPLDDERIWFRYHHLFADLLSSQLLRKHPQVIPGLHVHASIWYEQNGWLDQAIEHAFSARDLERVGRLIESRAQKLVYQVSMERMQNWINQLPEEMVLQKTWIGITQGWLWVAKMQTNNLDRWIEEIEERFLAGGRDRYPDSEGQDILANLASLRAYDAFFKGDLLRCAELSNQALNLLSPDNPDLRVRILVQLGETYLGLQDLQQAIIFLYKAIEMGIAVEDFQSVTTASMRLYRALRTLGRLNEAEGILQEAFQALSRANRESSPVATKLEQCRCDLLRERGQTDKAGAELTKALEHARQYNSPLDIVTSQVYRSMWLISQADWVGAQKSLEETESLLRSFTIPPLVVNSFLLQKARLFLERGELEHAGQLLDDLPGEEARILKTRLYYKKGELEKALDLLLQIEQDAMPGQRNGNLIHVYLLRAIVYDALGERSLALQALFGCLTLAHPQGYITVFLDDGERIYELLKEIQSGPPSQPEAAYARRLVQAIEQRRGQMHPESEANSRLTPAGQDGPSPTGGLVEPLSQRELEVLQLLSTGRTNKEIAQQLIISLGTVKAHTASIFRKLDVANRTEAVAHARRLGLLP